MENKQNPKPKFKPNSSLRLMDQVREVLRYHHYAYRTEQSYCQWILRYIRFHGKTHPMKLGAQHQDIDFGHNKIFVRGGKGGKDRALLPKNIRGALKRTDRRGRQMASKRS